MTASDAFSEYYAEFLHGSYDCVDRIVLNAFFPVGQTGGGTRSWWRLLNGDDLKLDDDHLREMAGTFSRRLHAFCVKHSIPLIEAQARERKHEIAEQYLPKDPNTSGLFLVIKGSAPAPVWEVKRSDKGQIVNIRHRKNWPYVRHFYFHIIDREWGHITIRMCGYPPFGAQIILNGHEWVERKALRDQLSTVKDGNCFVDGSDFPGINRLATELHRDGTSEHLRQVCERWIYSTCLCFALSHDDRVRSRFAYQYSVFQLELSRNLLFRRGTTMNEVYQTLIDRTRAPLSLDHVRTIFGFAYRPYNSIKRGHKPAEVSKSVLGKNYDLTVFKIKWGNLALKIYDKGARVLRIEVIVHNAKELRCGKVLDKLPTLLARMKDMLGRFLDTVQAAHVSFLGTAAFEDLPEPTIRGTRRLAGIDLNKARNRHVADAVIELSTSPNGFTVAQLAQTVQRRTGQDATTYSARNAAYDAAKMLGKALIRRIPRSRRYTADPSGVQIICAHLILREKIVKPVLAGVTRPRGPAPKSRTALDVHYMNLRDELRRTFRTIGIATA